MVCAAEEISMDAAAAGVLSEPDGIFTLKEVQRKALKAFLGEKKDLFPLPPTGFGRSSV